MITSDLKNKTIYFGILARDCELEVANNIPRIEELASFFKDYKVFVLENDSKDGTKEVLRTWMLNNPKINVNFLDTSSIPVFQNTKIDKKTVMGQTRMERMVILRNTLLDWIKQQIAPDYCLFIDIDINDFSINGVLKAICNAPQDWGGLFANGSHTISGQNGLRTHIPFQYDYYAYLKNNCSIQHSFNSLYFTKWYMPFVQYKMDRKVRSHAYFKCSSAFGGVGIYKWDAIKTNNYKNYSTKAFEKEGCTLCDHVSLNLSIIENGFSNYIARDILVDYGSRPFWNDNNYYYVHFTFIYYFFKIILDENIRMQRILTVFKPRKK